MKKITSTGVIFIMIIIFFQNCGSQFNSSNTLPQGTVNPIPTIPPGEVVGSGDEDGEDNTEPPVIIPSEAFSLQWKDYCSTNEGGYLCNMSRSSNTDRLEENISQNKDLILILVCCHLMILKKIWEDQFVTIRAFWKQQ